jgi:hypothetical protein
MRLALAPPQRRALQCRWSMRCGWMSVTGSVRRSAPRARRCCRRPCPCRSPGSSRWGWACPRSACARCSSRGPRPASCRSASAPTASGTQWIASLCGHHAVAQRLDLHEPGRDGLVDEGRAGPPTEGVAVLDGVVFEDRAAGLEVVDDVFVGLFDVLAHVVRTAAVKRPSSSTGSTTGMPAFLQARSRPRRRPAPCARGRCRPRSSRGRSG